MPERLVCVADVKNTLGEAPLWDHEAQRLYWVDITEQRVFQYDPSSDAIQSWDTPCEFSAIALCRSPNLILAGTRDGFAHFNLKTGKYDLFATPEKAHSQNRMNDGVCDPKGRFWCGSIHEVSDPSKRLPIASIYRVDADKSVHKIRPNVKTSNGFAWSPDGRFMYFTDTPTLNILVFDYDLDTGDLSNERVFATVPAGAGRPDGATVDVDGCLWSAHFDGWRVTRYSLDGAILEQVDLPVANVTSCAFGGPDLSTLYITTATENLTDKELMQQPLAGGVFAYQSSTTGLPMKRFGG